MWTRKNSPISLGFFCPEHVAASMDLPLPVFENQSVDYGAIIAIALTQMFTNIEIAELEGNATINATIHSQLVPGAMLLLKVESDTSDRTITFGTGLIGDPMTIPAGGTRYLLMVFNGTSYVLVSEREEDFAVEPTDTQSLDYAASLSIDIEKFKTIVSVATLTGDVDIAANIEAALPSGAILLVKLEADASDRNVTFGAGIEGDNFTLAASKTKSLYFLYDGTNFVLLTSVIINPADVQAIDYAASTDIDIAKYKTVVVVETLTGDVTIGANVVASVPIGAFMLVTLEADATPRNVTFGAGIEALDFILPAGESINLFFLFNGTDMVLISSVPIVNYYNELPDVQAPAYAANIALSITKRETFVNVAELTGDATITIAASSAVKSGAKVYLSLLSDTTPRTAVLSTGFKGNSIIGQASSTKVATFIYDGTNFIHIATQVLDALIP